MRRPPGSCPPCTASPTSSTWCYRSTRAAVRSWSAVGLLDHPRLHVEEPLGYVEFMGLVRGASLVLTDSGGVQEETTVLGVPCLTMRPNTERPVTITDGTNRLVTPEEVVEATREILARPVGSTWPVPPLWDGHAGERIAKVVATWMPRADLRCCRCSRWPCGRRTSRWATRSACSSARSPSRPELRHSPCPPPG